MCCYVRAYTLFWLCLHFQKIIYVIIMLKKTLCKAVTAILEITVIFRLQGTLSFLKIIRSAPCSPNNTVIVPNATDVEHLSVVIFKQVCVSPAGFLYRCSAQIYGLSPPPQPGEAELIQSEFLITQLIAQQRSSHASKAEVNEGFPLASLLFCAPPSPASFTVSSLSRC